MATTKKLMTLLSKQGLTEKRADIVSQFTHGRTSSVKALYKWELENLCNFFETEQNEQLKKLNKKRKRLIAVLFGIHNKMNKKVSIEYVKGIAQRAAKVDDFNKIPESRLDSLYNAFLNAQKDLDYSNRIITGFINEAICYN